MAKRIRWRNGVAKAVRTPRYKMRIKKSKKDYSRKGTKNYE